MPRIVLRSGGGGRARGCCDVGAAAALKPSLGKRASMRVSHRAPARSAGEVSRSEGCVAGVRLPSRLSSALTVAGILITLPPLSARKRRKPPFLFLFLRREGEELERCPQPRVQNKVDHCIYKTSAKCWDIQTLLWNRFGDKIHTNVQ